MKFPVKQPIIYIRPRQTDKQLLEDPRIIGHYQGIHMPATAPDGVKEMVRNLGKSAFIDPETYLYSLPLTRLFAEEKKTFKPSVGRLFGEYQGIGDTHITASRVIPGNPSEIDFFVTRVLEFQSGRLNGQTTLLNANYSKYADWQKKYGEVVNFDTSTSEPEFLIPPYFYFDKHDNEKYKLSLACAKTALRSRPTKSRIYPVIFLSKVLLKKSDVLQKIVDDYTDLSADGLIIWPNDFKEEKEPVETLLGLSTLVKKLSETGKPVLKFFGGYFSLLLSLNGLSGFSCGLGYGQSKNAFAYGAKMRGKFEPKYYIQALHRGVELPDAERLIRSIPALRCSCVVCQKSFGRNFDNFSKMSEVGMCECHFLNVRKQEIKEIVEKGKDYISSSIKLTANSFQMNSLIDVRALKNWAMVLDEMDQEGGSNVVYLKQSKR